MNRFTQLYYAALPFVKLVATTQGRIPHERLSFADWDELCKAFNACTPLLAASTQNAAAPVAKKPIVMKSYDAGGPMCSGSIEDKP